MAVTPNQQGLDLSIDAAGFSATSENAVYCTRPQGRMIQVGLPIGHTAPQIPMGLVAGKEIQIMGSHGFDGPSDLPILLEWISQRLVDPAMLVEHQVTLQEGAQAIMDMSHGSPLGITMVTKFHGGNYVSPSTATTTLSRL